SPSASVTDIRKCWKNGWRSSRESEMECDRLRAERIVAWWPQRDSNPRATFCESQSFEVMTTQPKEDALDDDDASRVEQNDASSFGAGACGRFGRGRRSRRCCLHVEREPRGSAGAVSGAGRLGRSRELRDDATRLGGGPPGRVAPGPERPPAGCRLSGP